MTSPSAVNRGQQLRDPTIPVKDRLIIALDLPTLEQAEQVVRAFKPTVSWFKVGSELFTAAGPAAVSMVHSHGGRVFLDLKYHDIPTVVASAVAAAARLGVGMVTVHLAGAIQGLRTIAESLPRPSGGLGRAGASRPWLLGVTRLTSIDSGITSETVVSAAQLALRSGFDGVVASAREAASIKQECGKGFLVIAPGIRPQGSEPHDQRRIATPAEAMGAGADYLVIGRPIVAATDPNLALTQILAEMEGVGVGQR